MSEQNTAPTDMEGLRTMRLEGRISQSDYLNRVEELATQAGVRSDQAANLPVGSQAAAGGSTAVPPSDPDAAIELLRQQRIEGKIGETQYLKELDRLHALKAGTTQEVVATEENTMAPPADENGYGILSSELSNDPELAPLDAGLRKAFLTCEIPAVYARSIVESVDQAAYRVQDMEPEQIKAEIENVQRKLVMAWGGRERFDANIAKIDQMLVEMAEADPAVADVIDSGAFMFACSPLALDLLARTAEHREARRGRA